MCDIPKEMEYKNIIQFFDVVDDEWIWFNENMEQDDASRKDYKFNILQVLKSDYD